MGSQDLLEISIQRKPSVSAAADATSVDIVSRPFGLVEFVGRFDLEADSQAIPLSAGSELQLGRLLDVDPIKFLGDGRWRLRLLASHAQLAHFA